MKKLKRILLCIAIAVLSLFGAVACSKSKNPSIVIVDEYFREQCIMNHEFDVTSVVENYNKKWKYEITECFYVDNFNDMKRYDITVVENTKFTQTAPYDVHVVLQAKSGKAVAEKEFVLTLVVPENDMQTAMIQSWSENGVSKRIEGRPEFVLEGEESSVKVTYLGSSNPAVNNGVNIGGFVCESTDASVTDWSNAVLTYNVYNPQSFDIQIGLYVMQGKSTKVNGIGPMYGRHVLKAGEWTQVNWSLRAMGFEYDVSEEYVFYFKMRIANTTDMVAPYNYTLYFCGMDIADYSADRFPELETRTEAEVWAAASGDADDKLLAGNYTNETYQLQTAYGTELKARVKEYASADGLSTPIEGSTSYIEYKIKASTHHSSTYYGNFLKFATKTVEPKPALINAELYAKYKDINWENAYISFWAYNGTEKGTCTLSGMNPSNSAQAGGKIIDLPYGQWTKVEVPLRTFCGVNSDPFTAEEYDVKLFVAYKGTECHTADTYTNFDGTLLIDGVTLEGRYMGENFWLTDQYSPNTVTINKYQRGALTAVEQEFGTVSKPAGTSYESYVEYTMTGNSTVPSNQTYTTNFLNFSDYTATQNTMVTKPMPAEQYAKYNIDWTNAYISFWLYNDADLTATLHGTKTVSGTVSNTTDGVGAQLQEIATKTWTQVTVKLSDVTSQYDIASGDYNIKLWLRYKDTSVTADNYAQAKWMYYVTGFEFKNLSADDLADQENAWMNEQIKSNYVANFVKFNRYQSGTDMTAAVQSFGEDTVLAPTGTEYSTYVSYSLAPSKDNPTKTSVNGVFINFSAHTGDYKISAAEQAMPTSIIDHYGSDFDWANASVTFWIYNDSNDEASLRGTKYYDNSSESATTATDGAGDELQKIAAKTWTQVTVKLSDLYGTNPSLCDVASGNYKIQLTMQYTATDKTLDNYTDYSWNFYVTGFKFVAGTAQA